MRIFAACCGPLLAGGQAPTAEALMRSRYTANVLGDAAYLLNTWDPDTRPPHLDLDRRPAWCSLEVHAVEEGGEGDASGTVEFVARYREGQRTGRMHEKSRFSREHGRWFYVDGDLYENRVSERMGRNDPCPCGSGRKFKKCCGA